MKRLLIVLLVVSSVATFARAAAAPDLTTVQRMRIVLDMMRDGNVSTPAAYASVDLADPATAVKWVDPLIWAYRPQYREQLAADTLTNNQKATLMLNIFRQIFRDARRAQDASVAADTARQSAIDTVNTDADIELGVDENLP